MAWNVVQIVHGTQGGGGVGPTATPASTTAGNLLVAVIGGSAVGSTATSFTMPAGWTLVNTGTLANHLNSTTNAVVGFAYYWNNPGSITSVQATWNANGGNMSGYIDIYELSGENTGSDPFDSTAGLVSAGVNGAAATLTASLTPTNPGEIVIAAFTATQSALNDWTTDSPWTQDDVYHFSGWNTAVAIQHVVDAGTTTESPSIATPSGSVSSVLGIIAFQGAVANTPKAISSTLTPSTTFNAPGLGRARATATNPTVTSSLLSDVVAHDPISTAPTVSTAFVRQFAISEPLKTIFVGARTTIVPLLQRQGTVSTSETPVSSLAVTRPRNILTNVFPSSTLRESATHPNFAVQSIITPQTSMAGTRPRSITVSPSPSSSMISRANRNLVIATTETVSSVLAKFRTRFGTLTTTLTPQTIITHHFVRSASIPTTLTPSTTFTAVPQRLPHISSTLITQSKITNSHGKIAATSTSLSPNSSITWHYTRFGALTSNVSPSTHLTETATHIYNPIRTFSSVTTTLLATGLKRTRSTSTLVTASTSFTQSQKRTATAISSSLTPSSIFAKIPVYHSHLSTGPQPSTRMTVQVHHQSVMHSLVNAWTFFVNPRVTTYERILIQRALMGGPLLQWLLQRPNVVTSREPSVVTSFRP